MEELLKRILKRGWKPRGYEDVYEFKLYKLGYTFARPQKQKLISFATEARHYINGTYYVGYKGYSLRELISKESGLWQFVCENKLVKRKRQGSNRGGGEPEKWFDYKDYEYRLIEIALKDEGEIEDFLLSNIKVEGN